MKTLNKKQTLARRIMIAFFVFSTVVAGSFSLSVFFTIHFVENKLLSAEMKQDLSRIIHQPGYKDHLDLGDDMHVYYQPLREPQRVPDWIHNIKPGFQEVFQDDHSYHSWTEDLDDVRYYLLSDQSDFERHERVLLLVIMIGFFISIFCSWLLGRKIVSAAIEPVIRLSGQVSSQSQLLNKKVILSDEYAKDEVGQLAAAFDHLTDKFRETLEKEKLFSADLSHELRTPLMIVASGCELLQTDNDLPDVHKKRINTMSDAAENMRQIVQTLLLLLRSENNEIADLPKASLLEISQKADLEWRPLITQNNLRFVVNTDGLDVTNEGNGGRLLPEVFMQMILNNLLRNALHNTIEGLITLTVTRDYIEVKDTGRGMPEHIQNQIFEPFFQGSKSTNRASNLGLGLSLVYRICANQNWKIQVDSIENGGSCFKVTF